MRRYPERLHSKIADSLRRPSAAKSITPRSRSVRSMKRCTSSSVAQVSSASRIQNSQLMQLTPGRRSSAACSVCMCSQSPSAFMPVSASMSPSSPTATHGMRPGTRWKTAAVPRCSVASYQSQLRATHGRPACSTTTPEHMGPSPATSVSGPSPAALAGGAMSA